jgi:hypothetical protein
MEIIINQIQIRHHQRHKMLLFIDVIRRKLKCVGSQGIYMSQKIRNFEGLLHSKTII